MILIVMKSLVLLMLVFGTVAADAEETSLLDMKESLQTKIKEAVPTDDFVKVLLDFDVENILKVLEQVPLEDRKKLCELMSPRHMVEYYKRLPVEDRERVRSCQGVLISYDQKDKYNPYADLLEIPLHQRMGTLGAFDLTYLRYVLKYSACPPRDDYDIGRMINSLLLAFRKKDNDNIEGTEDADLKESQGSAYKHMNRTGAPGDEEGNGYEEPFFKQIIEIQLGQPKGINVEQTPEIQR
ncbi:uncharacterized protein [Haliotis cracherodii]|uniref:uncharacterized protein n=1 Tax=Haliotis cracherodii TaxID=6455 RepID=UPI0039ED8B50